MEEVMRKFIKVISLVAVIIAMLSAAVFASSKTEALLSKYKNVDVRSMSDAQLEAMYNDMIESFTADELADMLQENKRTLQKEGISEETINRGAEFLRTTDDEAVRNMLRNTDVKEMVEKVKAGESIDNAVLTSQKNMDDTIMAGVKVFFSSYIVKTVLNIFGIYVLYKLIIRGIIFKKAGKAFAWTLVPIVRDAVLLKICGHSAWILLWLLLPIIGWIIYAMIKIIMKFELAEAFGHDAGFGVGVWLLNPIFEGIIAFSKDKYELA